MAKADFRFRTSVRVRWMECDAQGIVFNGAYLGYLEVAQAEYFRNLGFSIYRIARNGYFDSAVVKADLEFKVPGAGGRHPGTKRPGGTHRQHQPDPVGRNLPRKARTGASQPSHAIYVGFHAETGATRRVPDAIRALVDHFEATGEVLELSGFPELEEAAGQSRPGAG